jgi:putative SOS response-associated peptidase YedK
MTMMRWGTPPPPRAGNFPVSNIRNTASRHWRGWLKPEHRCLMPANSFAEYAPANDLHIRTDFLPAMPVQNGVLLHDAISRAGKSGKL